MQKAVASNQPQPAARTVSGGALTASKKDEPSGNVAIPEDDDSAASLASLATPSADSTGVDVDSSAKKARSASAAPPQQQSSYRSTVADYYGSSYWQQQSHPTYCSWNRTQSPLHPPSKVHIQHNTLPANYSTTESGVNNHAVQFRKPNYSGKVSVQTSAGTPSLGTADTQSTCSVDGNGLSHRTHQLSSSLILTPTNPVYLPTPTRKPPTTGHLRADPPPTSAFLMSVSPQSGGVVGPSSSTQTQLNAAGAHSAMVASAISTTPSTVMPQFCCECAATQNRCSTDFCLCYASRRMCDEHCESARYRGDCLNQAICKCSCEVDPSKPAKNVCTKSERCDCLRIKEGCSKLCACKQVCKNREPPKRIQKVAKPTQGCQCAKSKKQCVKKECQCRSVYEFCSSSCKCAGDCSNGASKFHVPKHVQSCFLEPKAESSGLIVTLIGNDYIYRGDFYHESKNDLHVEEQLVAAIYDLISKYKVDLYDIVIFVSKSPCFHQDCEPKCEVVDECRSNKACAKLLGLLLSKVRKELSKVDVRMTAKFLYPHLNRGDLYTKQGILSMLQAGIKVEPLLMKDWSAIMDWSPHADHKGEYLQMWGNHNLDRAVAQSQSFINECRRALGLSMKFWVAEIHEIVTNTILHYSEIRLKCNELNDALKQLDLTATPHKIRSTPSKRRSFIDIVELRDKLLMRGSSESRAKAAAGSSVSVASDDAHAQAMVASFCGRSFDDNETNDIAQRIRRATTNINVEIETLLEFLTHKSAVG